MRRLLWELVILSPALITCAIFIGPWWQFMTVWVCILFAVHYLAVCSYKRGMEQGYSHSRQILSEMTAIEKRFEDGQI